MKGNGCVLRITASFVLIIVIWTLGGIADIAYAIKFSNQKKAVSSQQRKKKQQPEWKLMQATEHIEGILQDNGISAQSKKDKLKKKKTALDTLDKAIIKGFKERENRLRQSGMSPKIMKRHADFVKKYRDRIREMRTNLEMIDKAKDRTDVDSAVKKAKEFLKKRKAKKRINLDRPDRMPHRNPAPVSKEPRMNQGEFEERPGAYAALSEMETIDNEPLLLAAMNLETFDRDRGGTEVPALLDTDGPTPYLTDYSRFRTSHVLLAASDPPVSDYLTETIEVRFSDAIISKAAELEYDPLKIYHWVRNNIEFTPTYGSIQGADYCLQTRLCNAFDTASLLIALLRSSGIHARYVEGTVEIPIEKVMNWTGGFSDKNAALEQLSAAAIPVQGITRGGEIAYARIEHVWVEAWIDYFPSRGARHRPGQGDLWIPLDASFKQYEYAEGVDMKEAVPFDAQQFIDHIEGSATINDTEGYVTSIDSSYINQKMDGYQALLEDYILQNHPDATVGDILGRKEIITQEFPFLLGTLPYRLLVRGTTYAELPDRMRHVVSFRVSKNALDRMNGTDLYITKSLPEVAGRRMTLSYSAATEDDEAVINSFLPETHEDGTPIDPDELPQSLGAYLIELKPELRINGEIAAEGTPVGMGKSEEFEIVFSGPGREADIIINTIEAGEYIGIGIDPGRISEEYIASIISRIDNTKEKLESHNYPGITKDEILGDILHATAISYFTELDMMDFVQARTMDMNAIRLPSETLFSFELQVNKFMDIPLSVEPGGLAMDADRIVTLARSLDGDIEKQKQFMTSSGVRSSALEHSVPEQMFSTPDNSAEGISAVKALAIANDQGIPIFTIDQDNIDAVYPQLQLDAGTLQDIRNAVHAGMNVTVSQTDIVFNGWNGCGYIITDPLSGDGAYMISGGKSGAWIIMGLVVSLLIKFGFALIITGSLLVSAPIWTGVLGAVMLGLGIGLLLSQILSNTQKYLIKDVFEYILEGSLPILGLLTFNFAFMVALLSIVISKLLLSYNAYIYPYVRQRKIYAIKQQNIFSC